MNKENEEKQEGNEDVASEIITFEDIEKAKEAYLQEKQELFSAQIVKMILAEQVKLKKELDAKYQIEKLDKVIDKQSNSPFL